MKPIKFQEVNKIFAENQEEYQPLPAFIKDNPEGEIVSCWHLSFKERFKLLITGKLWVSMLMFNQPLTPVYFTTIKDEVIPEENDLKSKTIFL